jgi:hypothetical protein
VPTVGPRISLGDVTELLMMKEPVNIVARHYIGAVKQFKRK